MKIQMTKMTIAEKAYVVMGVVALLLAGFAMYQQSELQAAEFRAHVAEELLEKSQDALVNQEVTAGK